MTKPSFRNRPGSGSIHPQDLARNANLAHGPAIPAQRPVRNPAAITVTGGPSQGSNTTLSVNAPLYMNNGALDIFRADSGQDGVLTSDDWTTFNDKEPGLGNPPVDGYLVASTAAGVRSWVAPGSGGGGGFLPDFAYVPPIAADWTTQNLVSSHTLSSTASAMTIVMAPNATTEKSVLTHTQPATPYAVDFGYILSCANVATVGMGCGVFDSASSRFKCLMETADGSTGYVQTFCDTNYTGSQTGSNDVSLGWPAFIFKQVRFMHVENDGTNITWSFGSDGINYVPYKTEAVGTNLTPTDLAIEFLNWNSTYPAAISFVHYQEH